MPINNLDWFLRTDTTKIIILKFVSSQVEKFFKTWSDKKTWTLFNCTDSFGYA